MTLSRNEARGLAQNAIAMQQDVLLHGREQVDERSLGFVFGEEEGRRVLEEIMMGIPIQSDPVDQAAYLVRAIVCAQILNEGNKRLATVFANFWLAQFNLRIAAEPERLEKFMLSIVPRCPKVPLPVVLMDAQDGCYGFVKEWLEKHVVKVN